MIVGSDFSPARMTSRVVGSIFVLLPGAPVLLCFACAVLLARKSRNELIKSKGDSGDREDALKPLQTMAETYFGGSKGIGIQVTKYSDRSPRFSLQRVLPLF